MITTLAVSLFVFLFVGAFAVWGVRRWKEKVRDTGHPPNGLVAWTLLLYVLSAFGVIVGGVGCIIKFIN